MPESKPAFSFTELDEKNFETHLGRVERGLDVYGDKEYPPPIESLREVLKRIIKYTREELGNELRKGRRVIAEKKKRGKKVDPEDLYIGVSKIKAAIKRILRLYYFYWGSVEFAVHSVPWYFTSMLVDIINRVLGKDPDTGTPIVVFPEPWYNLSIVPLEIELKKFQLIPAKINTILQEVGITDFFIFRIPPYLVLDPMANCLVFHEVGHTFAAFKIELDIIVNARRVMESRFREISRERVHPNTEWSLSEEEWMNRWINETISDCFSVAIGGPATLAALREVFALLPDEPSESHPPPTFRMEIVGRCIDRWLATAEGANTKKVVLKEYFGTLLPSPKNDSINQLDEMFDAIKNVATGANLFYFDSTLERIQNGVKDLENDLLPIDSTADKDWLFDYVLAFNGVWVLYLRQTEDLSGWRDKYNEIVLKVLEIEQFRDKWEEVKKRNNQKGGKATCR